MVTESQWEQRRLTARAARRLCDSLEEVCEEITGGDPEYTEKVFRRLWNRLSDLVAMIPDGKAGAESLDLDNE
jgi:hypothetical protein